MQTNLLVLFASPARAPLSLVEGICFFHLCVPLSLFLAPGLGFGRFHVCTHFTLASLLSFMCFLQSLTEFSAASASAVKLPASTKRLVTSDLDGIDVAQHGAEALLRSGSTLALAHLNVRAYC